MRLLVSAGINLALRRITSTPVSAAAAAASAEKRNHRSKVSAAPSSDFSTPKSQLQQLCDLSKMAENKKLELFAVSMLKTLTETKTREALYSAIYELSCNNNFSSIAKLLEEYDRTEPDKNKAPSMDLVKEVIWAAVHAKSLGALPPSILKWIEEAILRIPEPDDVTKESMIGLLSILRDDFPYLQQLQQESCSKLPAADRKKTLRYIALTCLQAGKKEQFRSLWTSFDIHPLANGSQLPEAALMHHAILRNSTNGKSDPAMLRWYAESLAEYQRTPIEDEPQFKMMMEPVIRALGGKIEKWDKNDRRVKTLRKWRDDYDDFELDKLLNSLIGFSEYLMALNDFGSLEDLRRLGAILNRLIGRETRGEDTIVIDWLNLSASKQLIKRENIKNLLPEHSLIVVGHENLHFDYRSPVETERLKVLDLTPNKERHHKSHEICSVILAVAMRGYLLTNDIPRRQMRLFRQYLTRESKDFNQWILLKKYIDDAVLRHDRKQTIQSPVDHSRAAQWIDKEKEELAFTVARKADHLSHDHPFRHIEYYSLHID